MKTSSRCNSAGCRNSIRRISTTSRSSAPGQLDWRRRLYAAEGLSVAVFDCRAPGGQAGASSRIENYLGFSTGISGQALAGCAFVQAQKFGAHIAIPTEIKALHCNCTPIQIELTASA